MYRLLQEHGIAVPSHIVVDRDGLEPGADPPGFIEEVGGWCVVYGVEDVWLAHVV